MADRIARVVDLLAAEFGWDVVTREACRSRLARHDPYQSFEFICDAPSSANFRLKLAPGGGYRVAYYGQSPDRQARADRITAELAAIDD